MTIASPEQLEAAALKQYLPENATVDLKALTEKQKAIYKNILTLSQDVQAAEANLLEKLKKIEAAVDNAQTDLKEIMTKFQKMAPELYQRYPELVAPVPAPL